MRKPNRSRFAALGRGLTVLALGSIPTTVVRGDEGAPVDGRPIDVVLHFVDAAGQPIVLSRPPTLRLASAVDAVLVSGSVARPTVVTLNVPAGDTIIGLFDPGMRRLAIGSGGRERIIHGPGAPRRTDAAPAATAATGDTAKDPAHAAAQVQGQAEAGGRPPVDLESLAAVPGLSADWPGRLAVPAEAERIVHQFVLQPGIRIGGRLVDGATGGPAARARVLLRRSGGTVEGSCTAGPDGRFRLPAVRAATKGEQIELLVSHGGVLRTAAIRWPLTERGGSVGALVAGGSARSTPPSTEPGATLGAAHLAALPGASAVAPEFVLAAFDEQFPSGENPVVAIDPSWFTLVAEDGSQAIRVPGPAARAGGGGMVPAGRWLVLPFAEHARPVLTRSVMAAAVRGFIDRDDPRVGRVTAGDPSAPVVTADGTPLPRARTTVAWVREVDVLVRTMEAAASAR